jgi:hypothetical protein
MPMITMPTSQKHAILLDTAMRRAVPGSQRYDFLLRMARSLNTWGSLTPAMIESLHVMITARSS